jgi:hypothetical protein
MKVNKTDSVLTVELALVKDLDLHGVPADCRDFIRLIYLTKLNKAVTG